MSYFRICTMRSIQKTTFCKFIALLKKVQILVDSWPINSDLFYCFPGVPKFGFLKFSRVTVPVPGSPWPANSI